MLLNATLLLVVWHSGSLIVRFPNPLSTLLYFITLSLLVHHPFPFLPPSHLRIPHFLSSFVGAMGVCDIGSSFIAGVLWERLGPAYPFLFASSSGCVALVCLLLWSQFVGPAEDVDLPPLPPPKIKVVDDHGDVGAPVKGERTPLLSTTTTTTLGDGYKSLAPIAAASDVGMAVGADKASAHEELRFTSNSNIADLEEGLRAQGYHPYYSRSRGTRKKRFYPVYPPVWLPNWDETHREEDEERRKEWRRYIRRSRSGWTWTNRWSTATNATTQPTAQTNKSSGET